MAYTKHELNLLVDSFKCYVMMAAHELQPPQVELLTKQLGDLLDKIVSTQVNNTPNAPVKPNGISDEYFESVCKSCNKFINNECTDAITMKYPGKCDPILHFESKKVKNT